MFAENIGPRQTIDETSLSNGELYTYVTNRDAHTREQGLVAVVSGTKSEDIIDVLKMIGQDKLNMVEEVTLDLSDSMRKAVRTIFPRANRVIDRFHILFHRTGYAADFVDIHAVSLFVWMLAAGLRPLG